MVATHSVFAVIAARGGSKGVPDKNIVDLGGRPLIAWTVEAARHSRHISRLIVSTDNQRIADVCTTLGVEVPFMRPAHLAADDTPAMDVDLHALAWVEERGLSPDYLLHLQPTSPFRTAEDIDAAVELAFHHDADAVVSLVKSAKHPYWMKTVGYDGRVSNFMDTRVPDRRQDLPLVYALNGAIYLAKPHLLKTSRTWYHPGTYAYLMPKMRSLDIDDMDDLKLARLLAGEMQL